MQSCDCIRERQDLNPEALLRKINARSQVSRRRFDEGDLVKNFDVSQGDRI